MFKVIKDDKIRVDKIKTREEAEKIAKRIGGEVTSDESLSRFVETEPEKFITLIDPEEDDET